MNTTKAALASLLVTVLASATAAAQVKPVPQLGQPQAGDTPVGTSGATYRANTELVALNVTVTDNDGRYVPDLGRGDFAVFDNGVPQRISFFATSVLPIDLSIMIDTSGSMADKISLVQQAAIRFVRTLRPGDRAEVLAFSNNTHVLVPFTSDRAALEAAIGATAPHGGTALYNALYIAIGDLARLAKTQTSVRRQAIVVLTDGDDTASSLGFEDVENAAKRSSVAIYPISVISKQEATRIVTSAEGRYYGEAEFSLRTLAQLTGARAFFPLELSDLKDVYGDIANELSTQYSLGYEPGREGDGAYHHLFVRVLNHPGARPRTRAGYYAARPINAWLVGR